MPLSDEVAAVCRATSGHKDELHSFFTKKKEEGGRGVLIFGYLDTFCYQQEAGEKGDSPSVFLQLIISRNY